jgi:hypothetical protein
MDRLVLEALTKVMKSLNELDIVAEYSRTHSNCDTVPSRRNVINDAINASEVLNKALRTLK